MFSFDCMICIPFAFSPEAGRFAFGGNFETPVGGLPYFGILGCSLKRSCFYCIPKAGEPKPLIKSCSLVICRPEPKL